MKSLTEQELHNLAMNIVGRELEADGFEFMAVNSTLKKHPQFVCLKNKDLHFILVRAVLYPENTATLGGNQGRQDQASSGWQPEQCRT